MSLVKMRCTVANAIRHMAARGYQSISSCDGYDAWNANMDSDLSKMINVPFDSMGTLEDERFVYDNGALDIEFYRHKAMF